LTETDDVIFNPDLITDNEEEDTDTDDNNNITF